jgi:hypothetical protein
MRSLILAVAALPLALTACSDGPSEAADPVSTYREQLAPRCQQARAQVPAPDATLPDYYRGVAGVLNATSAAVTTPAPPPQIRDVVLAQATEASRVAGLMTTLAGRLAEQDDSPETRKLIVEAEQAWSTWNTTAGAHLPTECTAS